MTQENRWIVPASFLSAGQRDSLRRNAARKLRGELMERDENKCRVCGGPTVSIADRRGARRAEIVQVDESLAPTLGNLIVVHLGCVGSLRDGGVELAGKILKENRDLAAHREATEGPGGAWIKVSEHVSNMLKSGRLVIEEKIDGQPVPADNFDEKVSLAKINTWTTTGPGNELLPVDIDKKFRQARELHREIAQAEAALPIWSAEYEDRLTHSELVEYVKTVSKAVAFSEFVGDIVRVENQITEENKQLLNALGDLHLDLERRVLLERIFNTWREGDQVFVILDPDLVQALANVASRMTSLSVDRASKDAVGGTSESTEQG